MFVQLRMTVDETKFTAHEQVAFGWLVIECVHNAILQIVIGKQIVVLFGFVAFGVRRPGGVVGRKENGRLVEQLDHRDRSLFELQPFVQKFGRTQIEIVHERILGGGHQHMNLELPIHKLDIVEFLASKAVVFAIDREQYLADRRKLKAIIMWKMPNRCRS